MFVGVRVISRFEEWRVLRNRTVQSIMLVVLHHVDEILYFGYRYRSIDLVLTMY
ncbi:uncharacterized protein ASPGLDRAFT_626436 [Aspergillus glaucus CBS 516.65]|uniref:Uncharacterized protein n=1 Tax=Aspergillus glaucus CBS 516.65 TaxID=1160497 RepID=A0A1L9VCD8_ASPGL|nr:hypothetical protein ASPGLDRAFT_626436 [Aspergillus glaucus CBS 516.65]OJJ81586.1 hypothetical protein ASPGLDRAFT_626436 [Aspergillus glaucus CBS 516.65]